MQTSILTRVLLENDLDEQSAVEGVYSSSWIHVGRGEVRSAIAAELCELTPNSRSKKLLLLVLSAHRSFPPGNIKYYKLDPLVDLNCLRLVLW